MQQEPAMQQPFRLLVTGSRTWDNIPVVEHALAVVLARHPEGVLLVHGACPLGAGAIAAAYAHRTPGYHTGAHTADWRRHGRAAGQRRNAQMITLGAGSCVAFLRGASPGTTATLQLARAGIPVWIHRQP
jgi:YspA, cpYpsA-related SLOG family